MALPCDTDCERWAAVIFAVRLVCEVCEDTVWRSVSPWLRWTLKLARWMTSSSLPPSAIVKLQVTRSPNQPTHTVTAAAEPSTVQTHTYIQIKLVSPGISSNDFVFQCLICHIYKSWEKVGLHPGTVLNRHVTIRELNKEEASDKAMRSRVKGLGFISPTRVT